MPGHTPLSPPPCRHYNLNGLWKKQLNEIKFVCVSLNPALSCMHSSCYPAARSAPIGQKGVVRTSTLSRSPLPSTPCKSACQHLDRTGRINRNRSRVVRGGGVGTALRNNIACGYTGRKYSQQQAYFPLGYSDFKSSEDVPFLISKTCTFLKVNQTRSLWKVIVDTAFYGPLQHCPELFSLAF